MEVNDVCRPIMLLGTMSHVGKSTVAAALCRSLVLTGKKAAPFKGYNLASQSAILSQGEEIGVAQAIQSAACNIVADGRMNPVMVKETSSRTEFFIRGKRQKDFAFAKQRPTTDYLRQEVLAAYQDLQAEYPVCVIEGSGSCGEWNLQTEDIANFWLAEQLQARVFLIADIERGGVFAQVYGTLAWLPPQHRQLVQGIIVNKFCGDLETFSTGRRLLEERCGLPVIGVLPWLETALPPEDGAEAYTIRASQLLGPEWMKQYDRLAFWLTAHLEMEQLLCCDANLKTKRTVRT